MIQGYAVKKEKGELTLYFYEPMELRDSEVLVDITHCGICHSDIHLIDNDWSVSSYPFIPGHEIIGNIAALGKDVAHLSVGQRVGIGWESSSCAHCEWCIRGEENLCSEMQGTCVGRNGGFATQVVSDNRFAFLIPEGLDSAHTAPLLCGGITVFSPFRHHGITPMSKVAILGIGGLGHMAIQFARAFGSEITVFSTSKDKEKEARSLGANHFIPLTGDFSCKERFDFILSTVPVDQDWQKWINLLRPKGKLCFVGAAPGKVETSAQQLISKEYSIVGSVIGDRPTIQEMLDVAEKHNIKAIIEEFPLSDVNKAIEKVRSGKIRYRAVLKI